MVGEGPALLLSCPQGQLAYALQTGSAPLCCLGEVKLSRVLHLVWVSSSYPKCYSQWGAGPTLCSPILLTFVVTEVTDISTDCGWGRAMDTHGPRLQASHPSPSSSSELYLFRSVPLHKTQTFLSLSLPDTTTYFLTIIVPEENWKQKTQGCLWIRQGSGMHGV